MAGVGHLRLTVDGAVLADTVTPVPDDPVQTMTRPGEVRATVGLQAGQEAAVRLDFRPAQDGDGPLAVRLGITADTDEDTMIAEAVRAAAASAAAVVVVGSAEAAESEGFDRETLALPGRQDELVARVAAVNQATVVVVNAGMPVLMPWAADVSAIVYAWLPGQAMGEALADMLTGRAEPGGRLPVTLPVRRRRLPGPARRSPRRPHRLRRRPARRLPRVRRGRHHADVRVRAWAWLHPVGLRVRVGRGPRPRPGEDVQIRVVVRNTGQRCGREVVQAYVAGPVASAGRPVRVLGGFGAVTAEPVSGPRWCSRCRPGLLAVYDQAAGGWAWPRGPFGIGCGRSSRDLRLEVAVRPGG